MIGTKVKVGYDGAAVSRGVKKTEKELRGLGKSMRFGAGAGVGMAATGGIVGSIMQGVSAVASAGGWTPSSIKGMLDFVGSTNDIAVATRSTAKDIVVLQEALRLTGAESVDTARMILQMNQAINDAARGDETAMDTFKAIGFGPKDIENMRRQSPIEQFKSIGKAISETMGDGPNSATARGMPGAKQNMPEIVGNIFGTKMRAKLLPALTDIEGTMSQAESNTKDFNDKLGENAGKLDDFGDALGRFEMTKMTNALDSLSKLSGGDIGFATEQVNKFFDNPGASIKEAIDSSGVMQTIGDTLESIKQGFESINSIKAIFQ